MSIPPIGLAANTVIAAPAQHVLHRDYETRGVLNLRDVGPWKYAADPRTEVIFCAYAVDDGPAKLWQRGDPEPEEFHETAHNLNWLVAAHNDAFETAIEHFKMRRQHGWSKIPLNRHRCTMAMSLALALPGKLERVAEVLELVHQKDKAGARLMQMMSRPRKPHKDEDPQALLWFEDAERMQRWGEYALHDVEVERELHGVIQPLIPQEQNCGCLIRSGTRVASTSIGCWPRPAAKSRTHSRRN
jgi:hypothetical protein